MRANFSLQGRLCRVKFPLDRQALLFQCDDHPQPSQPELREVLNAVLPNPINSLSRFITKIAAVEVSAKEQRVLHAGSIGITQVSDFSSRVLSQLAIASNCRFSCELRISGLAIAPQRRSAMIVAARYRCVRVGRPPDSSQVRMSLSASRRIILPIDRSSTSICRSGMCGGIMPLSSMDETRFDEIPARPMSRSRAIGGAVDIRSIWRTFGLSRRIVVEMFVRLLGGPQRRLHLFRRLPAPCPGKFWART